MRAIYKIGIYYVYAKHNKKLFKKTQQQQHSLLSQASWGRLEMKPKREDKQGDT
jgi:hypothetical protein